MERSEVFDAVAEQYDSIRPGYPDALVERVLAFADAEPPSRLLEIGCGSGIATPPYAERGFRIDCVEPGGNLIAIARRKLAAYPSVRLHRARFEDWEGIEGAFDLIYSATAWHWIDPEVRYSKSARLLKPAGALAVYFNWAAGHFEEAQDAYRRHLPDWADRSAITVEQRIERGTASLRASGCFRDIETHVYPWSRTFSADEYVRLLGTHSDHGSLPPPARDALFADVHACIEEMGGRVERDYVTTLWLSRPA